MARILKEDEYQAKRNEIITFSLSLVYSKGYSQMTIQDVLDGLHISRGAFYHYFDSKQALLEAMVEHLGLAAIETVLPILQDPHLTAIEKFRRYFEVSARWKNEEKGLLLGILRAWYADENTIIRQKITSQSLKSTARLLEPVIRQGVEEKVFTTRYPEQVATIIAGVALSLADTLTEPMLIPQPDQVACQKAESALDAYFDSIERILGAPPGSLKVLDANTFAGWWDSPESEETSP